MRKAAASMFMSTALSLSVALPVASADPANDALAQLSALSRQAEQVMETLYSARAELAAKNEIRERAEIEHARDVHEMEKSRSVLNSYRDSVKRFAAAQYMRGGTGVAMVFLNSSAPYSFIEKLSVEKIVNDNLAVQMDKYRAAKKTSEDAEAKSAESENKARQAASDAQATFNAIRQQQSVLSSKIAQVRAKYAILTAPQREDSSQVVAGSIPENVHVPSLIESTENDVPNVDAHVSEAVAVGGGSAAARAVQAAMTQLGTPYSWGGAAPGGFDCSGLVSWAFRQAGVSLPHSSQALASGGQPVSLSDMQPGDIISYYGDASHVGIYVGDGKVVHAATYGVPVAVVPVAGSGPVHNVRRY